MCKNDNEYDVYDGIVVGVLDVIVEFVLLTNVLWKCRLDNTLSKIY